MEVGVADLTKTGKNVDSAPRKHHRCGVRHRLFNTRMSYMQLTKLRAQGYVPFFVAPRKSGMTALMQTIPEAFLHGVSI